MQNSAFSQNSSFPPKFNAPLPQNMISNPFAQQLLTSMMPFSMMPPTDVMQLKQVQMMFEKLMQMQLQRAATPFFGFNSGFDAQLQMAQNAILNSNPQPMPPIQIKIEDSHRDAISSVNSGQTNQHLSAANISSGLSTEMNNASEALSSGELKKPEHMNKVEIIKEMLYYFAKRIGTVRRSILEKDGEAIHRNDEDLKEIFNGLMRKFLSSKKTKEEKIKYILRKCFKFMKDRLLEESGFTFDSFDDHIEKLNSDKVDKMFFKHYFSERCGKQKKFLTKNEITFIKDIAMPFRKNSQNKTMNIDFLRWIFSNEKFLLDYKLFLKNFNDVTIQDNVEKISKTANKIHELMATKNYKGFSQKYFKRMPWLDIWRIEAKEIALSLIEVYGQQEANDDSFEDEDVSSEPLLKKIKIQIKEEEAEKKQN